MREKVAVMLKMDALSNEILSHCSKLDRRTMSAYVSILVEADARSKGLMKSAERPVDRVDVEV